MSRFWINLATCDGVINGILKTCHLELIPYLCFISLSYLVLYVLGDDALIC